MVEVNYLPLFLIKYKVEDLDCWVCADVQMWYYCDMSVVGYMCQFAGVGHDFGPLAIGISGVVDFPCWECHSF